MYVCTSMSRTCRWKRVWGERRERWREGEKGEREKGERRERGKEREGREREADLESVSGVRGSGVRGGIGSERGGGVGGGGCTPRVCQRGLRVNCHSLVLVHLLR